MGPIGLIRLIGQKKQKKAIMIERGKQEGEEGNRVQGAQGTNVANGTNGAYKANGTQGTYGTNGAYRTNGAKGANEDQQRKPLEPQPFLPKKGNYRGLLVYQKAECLYDITFFFAHQ